MMTKDEALKMAIEAIERLNEIDGMYGWGDHLRACKEALEQPESWLTDSSKDIK